MTDSMFQQGDAVPHFEVTTIHGEQLNYSTVWQRKNLVLVALPESGSELAHRDVSHLVSKVPEFEAAKAVCVLTRDRVPGILSPGLVVADKWGEIAYVAFTSRADELPSAEELLDWVHYLESRCPECEGESK